MEFDRKFQQTLVAMQLRSPSHAKQIAHLLKPEWLDDEILADISAVAMQHASVYGGPPTRLVLAQECGQDVIESAKYQRLMKVNIADAKWVMDQFGTFCRLKAVKEATIAAAKDIEAGNLDNLVERMQKAVQTGAGTSDLGTRFWDFQKRKKWYTHNDRVARVVPTGIAPLDRVMHGGLGAGELGVIMAPPKGGKSFVLLTFALNPLRRTAAVERNMEPFRCAYITLENSDVKTYQRVDRLLAGKRHALMDTMPVKFIKSAEARASRYMHKDSDLVVKRFPNGTLSPNDLRMYLDQLQSQWGWEPNLICVDYLDEMRADRQYADKRFELSHITSGLRAIAIERNCPIWTATATQRAAINKKIITMDMASEDIGKVRIADAIITLCTTEEEQANGEMRMYLAAMRDAAMGLVIDMEVDYARSIVRAVGQRARARLEKSDGNDKRTKQIDAAMKRAGKNPSRTRSVSDGD